MSGARSIREDQFTPERLARQIEAMAADPLALNNAAARALTVGRPNAASDLADLVERVGGGAAPVLLLCDHAGRQVPEELDRLGLSDEVLARHIGWDIGAADMTGIRPASEPYATLLAKRMRERLNATWGLAEAGAAGPSGNRYGDPAGHTCVAIAGPLQRVVTLRTGNADREANMRAFAARALELLAEAIGAN